MGNLGEFSGVDDRQLVADAVALAERESSLVARKLDCLAEIERRGLAVELGASSVSRWWARGLRITQGAADRDVALALWLSDWPVVHRALHEAEIHRTHAAAIADGLSQVAAADPQLSDADRTAVVEDLLRVARDSTAPAVQRCASTLALSAAADAQRRADTARAAAAAAAAADEKRREPEPTGPGPQPEQPSADTTDDPSLPGVPPIPPAENADLNRLTIHPLANGRSQIDGNFDVLLTEKLKTALAPYSAPRPGPNGERDPRSPAKRTADALSDVLDQSSGSGRRPVFAGIVNLGDLVRRDPAEPTPATADSRTPAPADAGTEDSPLEPNTAQRESTPPSGQGLDPTHDRPPTSPPGHDTAPPAFVPPPGDLFRDDWPFHLAWAGPISRALAELVTCDAEITPIIVDGAGVPLAMGRTERWVTPAQRTAVIVRDRACIMCGRPAQWCDVHHMVHWADGGTTDLDNEALLCRECHRQVHQQGWEIVLGEDRHPWIIPPASVDSERQPRPSHHRRQKRKAA